MGEYIEREALLNEICNKNCGCGYDGDCPNCRLISEIEKIPAADVAQVVRCGDCRHYVPEIEFCEIHSHFVTRSGDFCYPGESSEWKTFEPGDYCSQGEKGAET